MDALAKVITAIGVFLGAIAWPIVVLILLVRFGPDIKSAIGRVPSLLDRMRKMKIAGVEAELDKVANASDLDKTGDVTPEQIETATRIADEFLEDLVKQLDRLCLDYDAVRRSLQGGSRRTQAMTRIVVKMRALAPSVMGFIELYKGSGSAGSRLAAIAMMQMNAGAADIQWLAERFEKEYPFVFYHAALALQNYGSDGLSQQEWDELLGVAHRSLETVRSFDGIPDRTTIEVLERLISSIAK